VGLNLAQKIIKEHLVSGEMKPGTEIAIRIDQTLTQDSTGTMAYLQFEAMGIPRVKTKKSVAYIDHNTLQTGFENADDHKYIQTVAAKHGIYFSKPGNGICHQVHLERFGVPGMTLLGSDSHTPTGGIVTNINIHVNYVIISGTFSKCEFSTINDEFKPLLTELLQEENNTAIKKNGIKSHNTLLLYFETIFIFIQFPPSFYVFCIRRSF